MDQPKYTTLFETLKAVPDPRHARGQRYSWLLLLTLIAAALASGQKTIHAIADWVKLHADDLRESLQPPKGRLPSGATFYRALRAIDLTVQRSRPRKAQSSTGKLSTARGCADRKPMVSR